MNKHTENAENYYVFLNAPEVFVEHTTQKGVFINKVTGWKGRFG